MKENFNEFKNKRIEETANYEGNDTLLLFERLNNKEIKDQLIDTYIRYYATQDERKTPKEYQKYIETEDQKIFKTREEINQDIEKKIALSFSQTNISYDQSNKMGCLETADVFGCGTIYLQSINPETNEKYSEKQRSIAEAHEKGHSLRYFNNPGELFESEVLKAFDFSKIETEKYLEEIKTMRDKNSKFFSDEKILLNFMEYHKSPMEIFERMSQLKNYFGMSGNENFTKDHLDYAKKNYIKDTGVPEIQIKIFLDAITPETEKYFLNIINTWGI